MIAVNDNRDPNEPLTAGDLFISIMEKFQAAWTEAYPSEPFVVDGHVTPRGMAFIAGYVAGRREQ